MSFLPLNAPSVLTCVVSGATSLSIAINGTYTQIEDYLGNPQFKHNVADYWLYKEGGTWQIEDAQADAGTIFFERNNADYLGSYSTVSGSGSVVVSAT